MSRKLYFHVVLLWNFSQLRDFYVRALTFVLNFHVLCFVQDCLANSLCWLVPDFALCWVQRQHRRLYGSVMAGKNRLWKKILKMCTSAKPNCLQKYKELDMKRGTLKKRMGSDARIATMYRLNFRSLVYSSDKGALHSGWGFLGTFLVYDSCGAMKHRYC